MKRISLKTLQHSHARGCYHRMRRAGCTSTPKLIAYVVHGEERVLVGEELNRGHGGNLGASGLFRTV